ncbi:unnamed protein product [Aspergillus oryzae]|uniref:Unnamed protein product n=2 Tax=Aspergillus oryzae TaxID=5062 RepID=A0AAN5BV46_ASPOZ|nr:unnamed protein product [Aspergillus oryzae]GMF83474.1 unnamed protein product [Aspergillus oryzae]GMG04728.1 unnamed protein product [Aspergillus oryzae]GMG34377.1 unnamed protein product [Aspergillus oryzae]GMG41917.1 unnamed protein product [Aspergillus oryzae var. brunneus]
MVPKWSNLMWEKVRGECQPSSFIPPAKVPDLVQSSYRFGLSDTGRALSLQDFGLLSPELHALMSQSRSRGQQSADVEECPHDPTLQGDGAPKKPVTAEEALEIAIGESQDVEYTIDSDNSPYLEVRANVPNTDDPTLPINTFRMWFLGIVGTGVNQFFSMRYPSVTITSLVAQLISYPVGCFFAKAMPIMTIRVRGREIPINPDHHFNVKEHAVITIMSNLSFNQSWVSVICNLIILR